MTSGFGRLWLASTGSNLGDGVVLAALPLLAATYTRDPLLIGGLTFAAGLPWLLFSLIAGALVDRLDRRVVMVAVDVGRAAVVGVLALAVAAGWADLALVYAVVIALAVGETLFDTAAQTILPVVVPAEDLERANGRLFAAQVVSNQFLGPPLGGLLFAAAIPGPLLFDAVTFLLSSLLLSTLPGRFTAAERVAGTTVRADIREGLRFLWTHRSIRVFALGAATINFSTAATAALFVLFAKQVLGLSPVGYGLLLGAGAVGSLVGSLTSVRVTRGLGKPNALVLSIACIALAQAGIGLSASPPVTAASFALFGFGSDVWNVIAVSYRQRVVPDRLLGRLNAAYRLLAHGALPLGGLFAGALARWSGMRAPYLAGSALVSGLALFFLRIRTMLDTDAEGPPRAS